MINRAIHAITDIATNPSLQPDGGGLQCIFCESRIPLYGLLQHQRPDGVGLLVRMTFPSADPQGGKATDNTRPCWVGGLQIRVALICGLIQMCDGYDVGTIGWSVPSLTHAWQMAPSAFALAFLWSNIGCCGRPPPPR